MTVAWTLTSGEAGMRTQARGLASAVAGSVIELIAPASPLAALLPRLVRPHPFEGFDPPWPDLIVSCGRRSVPYALEARRRGAVATTLVHVQDPRGAAPDFDLIVAMSHDRIVAGPGVIKVATALHDLTPAALDRAAAQWRNRLEALQPFAGVIVGGDLKGRPFTLGDARRLIDGLKALRGPTPVGPRLGLAITPSRRTPVAVRALLTEAFAGDPKVFVWNLEGDNPYRAILALADRLVVTGDSVSMISEAISTTHAVDVLDLGFARHAAFLQTLADSGRVRRFTGDPNFAREAPPIDATNEAADAVRRLIQARTGVSG